MSGGGNTSPDLARGLPLIGHPRPAYPGRWVRSPKNFTLTLASMVGYGILISFIGFFPASALFMAALSWMLGFRRPVFILLGTGLILGFVWLVFVHFLGVPVPMGIWGE